MAPPRRVYVDTNVFIRLFEGTDEVSRELARLFLIERKGSEQYWATSELALAELLVGPYKSKDDRLISLYDNWTVSNSFLEVGPVTRDALWYAAVLRSQHVHLRLPDAIHLSTAIGMRCSHFLSDDRRLRPKYELVHTRFGITRGPVTIDVVRPEASYVRSIVDALT